MSIQRLPIREFFRQARNKVLLDVRSPGEYNHAHIPGAIGFPLFSDEERKVVGTTYKQNSREQAIKIGLDFFGPKMRRMVEEAEEHLQRHAVNNGLDSPAPKAEVFVYCWRGGMRSAAVAWLLDLYGFRVHTLAGGYKAFRNLVLETFGLPFQFKVLGGFTGSGKSEVLQQLSKEGEVIVDLEQLAVHKGSAFGGLKTPQPTQEMFENLLGLDLLQSVDELTHKPQPHTIWLEDESQRIGNLNIPNALWQNMRKAPVLFLQIPFAERLNYIVREYGNSEPEKLIAAVGRITKRLGGVETKSTLGFLEQGDIKEAFRILLHYYDKRYLKGLHNREAVNSLLTKIDCDTVTAENVQYLIKQQTA